ncbi:(2Fe-2S)-binding protein [Maritimibacter sp. 55A14]|uniref:(2Fe-2S)-binding protein n=1 Tax=Maritimibacter sp. 55A14 TaxID=2174844 RepID=UPI000D607824|nr:(2Fe-2S)-binding protein [Maritimibacter sp. 55A14]PWE31376.1 (2Fe-2S)-binding protein [Maritimibacter sp. 55A14]
MIVCHCTGITDREIREAVDWMRLADPYGIVTAGRVYRALGKRPECGGCMPLFLEEMSENNSFSVPATPQVPNLASTGDASNEG